MQFTFIALVLFFIFNPATLAGTDQKIKNKAATFSGHFRGMAKKKSLHFEVKDCSVSYERGEDIHPGNEKDYKFERFIVSYLGENKKDEVSFDSVTYGHSALKDSFKAFDYTKSFGPVKLRNLAFSSGVDSELRFERLFGEAARFVFKHSEKYSTENSSFFRPGEERDYHMEIFFKKFTDKVALVDKVNIDIISKYRSKKTRRLKKEVIAKIQCSEFSKSDED